MKWRISKYYFALCRPINLGIIAMTQLLFILKSSLFSFQNLLFPQLVYVILATCFTAAAGYVINDIFDIEADEVNKPNRTFIPKIISLKNARLFYVCLMFSSTFFGFLTGWTIGFLCMAVNLLLYYYATDLKGTVLQGNLLVSFLSAATIFIASRGSIIKLEGYFSEYAIFAFLVSMAREIVKDIEDMEGDKIQGYETFPIQYGIKQSKWLAYSFIASVAIMLLYLIVYSHPNLGFKIYAIACIYLPIFVIFYLIYTANNKRQFHIAGNAIKILMVLGLLSVLFI